MLSRDELRLNFIAAKQAAAFDAGLGCPGAGTRSVRLRLGTSFLHAYDQPPKGERGGAVHHLGVATNNLLALVESMKQKGYVFRKAIRDEPKFRYVMVAAPDGVLVELFESKEPRRWQLPSAAFPDAAS